MTGNYGQLRQMGDWWDTLTAPARWWLTETPTAEELDVREARLAELYNQPAATGMPIPWGVVAPLLGVLAFMAVTSGVAWRKRKPLKQRAL